jgi:CubicO group peptidase (beta-lactamase class C family)
MTRVQVCAYTGRMHDTRQSRRTTRTRRAWPTLVVASCLAGAACVTPTADGDASASTPWEITPATTVDDGTAYWPGAQWRTATPGQVGMDSSAMAALSRDVRRHRWPTLRSLLVVRHGYVVLNEYIRGGHPDSLEQVQGVSATVTGLLVGAAVRDGKVDPQDAITQFFPEYADLTSLTRYAIRVDHLLAMRSCLGFYDASGRLGELDQSSSDWLRLIFGSGVHDAPGERWDYSSADAIVLGGILHAATGEPADAYARHALFAPLGITRFAWATGQPNGLPHMGLGLALTAPDMARIGYLMLRDGRWNGTPIVSDTWMAGMREPVSKSVGQWSTYELDYGRMLWILPPLPLATGRRDVVAAVGGGGQWIFVVPGKDLVVVATGDAVAMANFLDPLTVLYDIVVPATH